MKYVHLNKLFENACVSIGTSNVVVAPRMEWWSVCCSVASFWDFNLFQLQLMRTCSWPLLTRTIKLGTIIRHWKIARLFMRKIHGAPIIFFSLGQSIIRLHPFLSLCCLSRDFLDARIHNFTFSVLVAWFWYVHCEEWRSYPCKPTFCWMLWKYGKCLEGKFHYLYVLKNIFFPV